MTFRPVGCNSLWQSLATLRNVSFSELPIFLYSWPNAAWNSSNMYFSSPGSNSVRYQQRSDGGLDEYSMSRGRERKEVILTTIDLSHVLRYPAVFRT